MTEAESPASQSSPSLGKRSTPPSWQTCPSGSYAQSLSLDGLRMKAGFHASWIPYPEWALDSPPPRESPWPVRRPHKGMKMVREIPCCQMNCGSDRGWVPACAGTTVLGGVRFIFMVMTIVQRSPFAGITMALRRPHEGMKMASSAGMVEADPAPGPSLGPRDDMARWPGAIFIATTVWGRAVHFHSDDEAMQRSPQGEEVNPRPRSISPSGWEEVQPAVFRPPRGCWRRCIWCRRRRFRG